jgi:cytoskeleton protein RodZ
MPSAGELLRSERLKKNRSLTDIAEQTCISRRYLEAIETDSTNDLPGEFFYKAFIRQYAKALDLDGDTTDRILSSAVPLNEPDPVPVLSQVYERAQSGDSNRWRPPTGVAVALLLIVLAGGSLLYAWWQRVQAPPETTEPQQVSQQPPQQQQQPTASQSEPLAPPSESAPPTTTPQPESATAPTPTAAAVPPGQPFLEVTANEPAWVHVSSEGKTVFIGTIEPNQPRQFPTGANATLRTGNAGAVDVRWNGKPVGPLGPKGQIRVVRFTPEGAQVVQPQPKVVAPETTPVP